MMMQMDGGMMGMGVLWWLVGLLLIILCIVAIVKLTKS